MGLRNSQVGSQAWLDSLLQWIRSTVKHNDLLDVKGVENTVDGTLDKHGSSLQYKRENDHINDNSRHLTDFLDGNSNYVGEINSSNNLINITTTGKTVTIGSGLTVGDGIQLNGSTLELDVQAGSGMSITLGNPTVFAAQNNYFAVTKQLISTSMDIPQVFVPASSVSSGMRVIILGFFGWVWGATSWTAGALVFDHLSIQDTNANDYFRIPIGNLLGNTIISPTSLVTADYETNLIAGTGGDVNAGMQVVGHTAGHVNVAAGSGSDLWLTIFGVIR